MSFLPQHQAVRQIYHLLSYVFHPAVMMLAAFSLLSYYLRDRSVMVFVDAAVLILGCLPGFVYIYIKTQRGEFGGIDLLLKEERRFVLPLFFVSLAGSLAVYASIRAPLILQHALSIVLIDGIGIIVITRFWKISLHATIAMICATLLLPLSAPIAFTMIGLALVVGLSRILIGHHTSAQVAAGWSYGFGMTYLLLWLLSHS